MSAYVIATYDVVDAKRYEGYVPGVRPLLGKHGAEVLAADYAAEPLEGDRHSVYVILRFASEEAARAWYNDPAYEPVKKIRLSSCRNSQLTLVKQFVAPAS